MKSDQRAAEGSAVAAADDGRGIEMSMTVSPEMFKTMEWLSDQAGSGLADVFTRAIVLLEVAAKARAEGKQIGIAREGQPLETVIDIF
jgi:hypothetical protein